jgi:N4-gp56 family major capsid protein
MADTSQLLGQHFAKSRDAEIRDALLTTPNVLYSNDKSGRTALTTNDTFNVELIREAVERLATNKAPKFQGDAYICFIHPRQGRYLRKDPAWINASNYGAPGQVFVGEIGRIEDVRFIETTMIPYISKTNGNMYADAESMLDDSDTQIVAGTYSTNADVYQSLIIGDHCVGLAISQEVQLRDNGIMDFGRHHAMGYYGIWGCGLINPKHVFTLETA